MFISDTWLPASHTRMRAGTDRGFLADTCVLCTGVLVLSEFAGAAQSLGAGAILVNPWNITDMAAAIQDALTMSEQVKSSRITGAATPRVIPSSARRSVW